MHLRFIVAGSLAALILVVTAAGALEAVVGAMPPTAFHRNSPQRTSRRPSRHQTRDPADSDVWEARDTNSRTRDNNDGWEMTPD